MTDKTAEELVEDEILHRLKNDPHVVPATALFKFYGDMQKARERAEKEKGSEDSKPFSLLEELPTLPSKQALELAKEEVVRLEAELDTFYEVIRHLEVRDAEEGQGGPRQVVSAGERQAVGGQPVPVEGSG